MSAFQSLVILGKATLLSDWGPRSALILTQLLYFGFLGPSDYATFAIAVTTVAAAWALVDLGLGTYALREATAVRSGIVSPLYGFYLLSASMVFVCFAIFSVFQARPGLQPELGLMLACGLYLPFYAAYPDWALRGAGRLRDLALGNWTIAFVTAAPLLAASFVPTGESRLLAAGLAFGCAPGAAALVLLLRGGLGLKPSLHLRQMPRILKGSLPLGIAGACMSAVVPVALYALRGSASAQQVGLFALGVRVSAACAAAAWALGQNGLHILMEKPERSHELWSRTIRVAVRLAPLLVVVLAAVVTWSSVEQSFLALGLLLIPIYLPKYASELVLISMRADRQRMLAGMADLVAVLVLLAFLRGWATGPAVAVLGAEAFAGAILLVWANRMTKKNTEQRKVTM